MKLSDYRQSAEMAGAISHTASMRLHDARRPIAQRYEHEFEDRFGRASLPEPPEPTDEQLKNLRDRYLEHRALVEDSDNARSLVDSNFPAGFIISWVKVTYKGALFAAACVILYREFSPLFV